MGREAMWRQIHAGVKAAVISAGLAHKLEVIRRSYRMAAHLSVWASWIAQKVGLERGLGGSEPRPALTVRPRFATLTPPKPKGP